MNPKVILVLLVAGMTTVLVVRACERSAPDGPSYTITSLAFALPRDAEVGPATLALLAGGSDGRLRWWPEAGRPARVFRAHAGPVTGVAADPYGVAYSAGEDGRLQRWALDSATPLESVSTGAPIAGLAVSRDGDLVVTVSAAGVLTVRETTALAELWRSETGMEDPLDVAFSSDGGLVALSNEGGFRVFAWTDGYEETHGVVAAGAGPLAFVPQDERFWVGGLTKPAHLHSAVAAYPLPESLPGAHIRSLGPVRKDRTTAVRVSADETAVITGSVGGEVAAWHAITGEEVWRFSVDGAVEALAVRFDGLRAAVGFGAGVRVFDPEDGGRLDELLD